MLLGCIADDFTGASDLANVLARGGMRTVQFNGVPSRDPDDCEAGIVSLKTRSIPAADAVKQSLAALDWLRMQGCRQILFKVCSTFDSTREGNIGPVADALLDALGAPVTVVCTAYPTLKRSIHRGHLFVGDKLLNESGLENHPLNPMTDANLVRWLSYQTRSKVGLIPIDIVLEGAKAVRAAVDAASASGTRMLICDCVVDRDLLTLGEAIAGMPLVTGGSGIALGLPRNFGISATRDRAQHLAAPEGPGLALSGSCSIATRGQVETHARHAPAMALDVDQIIAGDLKPAEALAWAQRQNGGGVPLIYSSADPEVVRAAQGRYGVTNVAQAVEGFFGELATLAVQSGTKRLIVAGGETSSAVVSALGIDAMRIGPEIDPGVPALVADVPRPLALALKSGNFGAPDFFEKAMRTFEDMTP
jgi:uncharacterized protein YgbK (DUF1537 family)